LNTAKSKFSPGPAPKSDTRTYTATEQGITMTWKSVGADGKEITCAPQLPDHADAGGQVGK
jgi:hypothetical protein